MQNIQSILSGLIFQIRRIEEHFANKMKAVQNEMQNQERERSEMIDELRDLKQSLK